MAIDQLRLLARLLEVTRNLSTSQELEPYLQSLLSAASELTESETASIMEYNESTREFYFRFVPWFHREAVANARVPLEGSVAGWAFANAKPAIVDNARKDERHYNKIDELTGFSTQSLLAVPVNLHGKPVGVFEVFNRANGSNYTEADVFIIETLASLAATAMQNGLLESNAQAARDRAVELERLKNEFIAITSHELRTPLGLILGHATFLRELVDSEHYEQVDAIIRNASRLKEIVESLSSVDNYQTGGASLRQRKTSIARIVEDALVSFRELAAQKQITLKAELPPNDTLLVDVDSSKISIVLANLIKNALTFTNNGGHVIVRGAQENGFIKVSVQDDGVGIPDKELAMIFERFYQVESHLTRKHGGMGLGLSVAKAMIELHDGQIWAESKEGAGSLITFTLPVEQTKRADAAEA